MRSHQSALLVLALAFAPAAAAAEYLACDGCSGGGKVCVSGANGNTAVGDADCAPCSGAAGQAWWPCDLPADEGGCWCYDSDASSARVPPLMPSGLSKAAKGVCDVLTRDMYLDLTGGTEYEPYTYESFCEGVEVANHGRDELAFGMGTEEQQKAELAAFFGHALHESGDLRSAREYLPCGDSVEVDGKLYCKPCASEHYNWGANTCGLSKFADGGTYGSYCNPDLSPPDGCACSDELTSEEVPGLPAYEGYVAADKLFIGRGVIQLSWNYLYVRASVALTGSETTFCENPELVAEEGRYAWGSGIWFWMQHAVPEQTAEGKLSTPHVAALTGGGFGGTLFNINGVLECPGGDEYWHTAVVMRVNRYCRAARAIGLEELLPLSGCGGLAEAFDGCGEYDCPDCMAYKPSAPAPGGAGGQETGDDGVDDAPAPAPKSKAKKAKKKPKKKAKKAKKKPKKAKKTKKLSKKQVKRLCKRAKSKKACKAGDAKRSCTFSKKRGCTPK